MTGLEKQLLIISLGTFAAILITFAWDFQKEQIYHGDYVRSLIDQQYCVSSPSSACPVTDASTSSSSAAFTANPLFGRVAIVTGSTSGLGYEIARELFSLGATVYIASRSEKKVNESILSIRATHASSAGTLIPAIIDTSDFDSVKKFADSFLRRVDSSPSIDTCEPQSADADSCTSSSPSLSSSSSGPKLHYLINNAGIHYANVADAEGSPMMSPKVTTSTQGYDLAFATNYMGHFLLTELLLPVLQSSGPHSRILNVASTYHVQADGTMLRPDSSHPHSSPTAARSDVSTFLHRRRSYSNNKLAQVLHAKALAQLHTSVAAVSVCPGFVNTGIIPDKGVGSVIKRLALAPATGVLAPLSALFDPALKGGEFVSNFRDIWTGSWWSPSFFEGITLLRIRDITVDLLAGYVLLFQRRSYGYHVETTSPEGSDPELARQLYAWTRGELVRTGYLQ